MSKLDIEPENYPYIARELVFEVYSGEDPLHMEDIYVVWFCYILGGWKALLSTTVFDNKYYEVTYNANLDETYVDTYVKEKNEVF